MAESHYFATGVIRPAASRAGLLGLLADSRPDWHSEAACRGTGVDFFDERPGAEAAARRLCRTCPAVVACAAAGRREPAGIWGGRTPADRGTGRRRAG